MEGSRCRENPLPARADEGVLKALRFEGRRTAVAGSEPKPGDMADSAMGVTPAATGVLPPSLLAKNLALAVESPKDVMSFSADVLAMLPLRAQRSCWRGRAEG